MSIFDTAKINLEITRALLYAVWSKTFDTKFPVSNMAENHIIITSDIRQAKHHSKNSAHYTGHAIDISIEKGYSDKLPLLFYFFEKNLNESGFRMGIDLSKNKNLRHIHFDRIERKPKRFIEKNKKFWKEVNEKNWQKLREKIEKNYRQNNNKKIKIVLAIIPAIFIFTLLKKKPVEKIPENDIIKKLLEYQEFQEKNNYGQ